MRARLSVTLAIMVCVGLAGPAHADPETPPTFGAGLSGDTAEVGAEIDRRNNIPEGSGGSAPASPASANPFVYAMVPACAGNGPNVGLDALCQTASIACPAPQVMYWFFRAPAGTPFGSPGWSQTGQRCITPPTPGSPPVVVPGLSLEDFQRLPLPAGAPNIEPDNGYTLINVPTNVYAEAQPVVLDTTLLGFDVQVRATPASYSWDFGDGTTLGPTEDPGAPYPALSTTHTYAAGGAYAITLTTSYTGEYSVEGGPWLPVPGQAQVSSAPVAVEALSGGNQLVADPVGGG